RRDGNERVNVRTADRRSDHLAGHRRDVAAALLLPAGYERPDHGVVRHSRASGREREPPAGALAAAPDEPRGRGSAAFAEGRRQPWKRGEATIAELIGDVTAHEAAPGQQSVEERHISDGTAEGVTCLCRKGYRT